MGSLIVPDHKEIQFESKDKTIIKGVDTNLVSDGYHTFGELYAHRCLLFIAFANQLDESRVWRSKKHNDGSEVVGYFIAGANLAQNTVLQSFQISYHIPVKYWDLCDFPELVYAPEWDGHTSQDVVNRLFLALSGFI